MYQGGFSAHLSAVALASACLLAACGSPDPERAMVSARVLQEKGDRNAAILQLKSAIQENAEHAPSRLYLGLLYEEIGDPRSAEKELRIALERGADPGQVRAALARSLIMQGQADKALEVTSVDGITDPEAKAGILAARGHAELALMRIKEAQATFEAALAARPGYNDALLGEARVLAAGQRFDDALATVERALNASPQNVDALLLKGDLLRALRRSQEARDAYAALIAIRPAHVNGLLALIAADVAIGNLDEAAKNVASLQKAAPGNLLGSYFSALVAFRKNDMKAARDAVSIVLKAAPNHLPSLLLGGAVEFALGSQELAQTRLRYVLDKAPDNLYARRVLVASYARTGQTQRAIELITPVLKQGTDDPALMALAGELHLQANEYDKAQAYFQRAAALKPKDPAMLMGLGLSKLAAGDVSAATLDLESATQLESTRQQADVLLITTLLQTRQFDRAEKAARTLVEKQPSNPMSYNILAASYTGKGELENARRALEKALEVQPGYAPAATNLARLDLQKGDKQAARKRLEDVIAKDKANVQVYLALAMLGDAIGATPADVQGWLEAARRESPGAIQPVVLLARFHLQAGEPKRALELVEKALSAAPGDPEVLDLAGQVQLASGEKHRALSTFAKWSSVQPSAMASYRMATAQLANGDTSSAIQTLRKALEQRPQFPEAQALLGNALIGIGRTEEARQIAIALQRHHPRSAVGWIIEGEAYLKDRKFEQTAAAYEKAHQLSASSATAIKIHDALAKAGKPAEGERQLIRWLQVQPADTNARLYLAEAYLKDAKYPNAIAQYELVLQQKPHDIVALNNLAWCLHQVKDNRASDVAQKALQLEPKNPALLDTSGWILVEAGDMQRGLDQLKLATELAPNAADIRYHYAQALVRAGQRAKGKDELERLLLASPQFQDAGPAMRLLNDLRKQ